MKKLYVLTLLILILNPVTAFAASSSWDVMIWDEDVWYPDNFTMITSGEVTLTETTQGTSVKFSIRPAIEPVQTPLKVSIVNTCESKVMIVSSNELVFDQTNWEKEQYFELKSSFDDESLIDEQDCTIQIYVKGDTQPYDHLKDLVIPVHIVDNDRIGLKISDKPLSVTENGNLATYSVCLMSKPSSSVTLTTFLEQVTVSPPKLILTPSNYNIPQMITITAIDDKKFEQDHDGKITHELESEDSHYNNFLSELQVSIIDNDRAEISSNMPINIGEAGPPAQLKLQLTSMPDDDVTINLMTSDQVSLTLSTLTFKSLDWNKPQLIGVSAINDNIDEGNDYTTTIIYKTSSTDSNYNFTGEIDVNITDNDTAGLSIQDSFDTFIAENAAGGYSISLTSRPISNVYITIHTDNQISLTSPSIINFKPDEWNQKKSVMIKAEKDDIEELDFHSGMITHTIQSEDSVYQNLFSENSFLIDVTIKDNDTAGVHISNNVLELDESETEFSDSYTSSYSVRLLSKPTDAVTITFDISPEPLDRKCDAQAVIEKNSLTFLPENWDINQTVKVKACNDNVYEPRATNKAEIKHIVYQLLKAKKLPITYA
jgi:predicted glutamine amidotransferase